MCGAATRSEASRCQHCGARLATVACPSCFGMVFAGTKFCPHCGAAASRKERPAKGRGLPCPRCALPLTAIAVGSTTLHECGRCDGLWVAKEAFARICADQEKQSALLGHASIVNTATPEGAGSIRYVPCVECGQLMHRLNFANCSGVIVDVCKDHGTWFDRDELARIVAFIRAGGLERSRERREAELAEAERRVRRLRAGALNRGDGVDRTSIVLAAGDLLFFD